MSIYTSFMNTPLMVLAIIDGFGFSPQTEGNAIYHAQTPTLDTLWSQYPHFLLKAAEEEVGLAFGEIGNSEVGHITIGTGRVIPQNMSRINRAIEEGTFYENPAFLKVLQAVKTNQSNLHLFGIISTSGVHGHLFHYQALIKLAAKMDIQNVYLHLILDGRDSGPQDSPLFLKEIDKTIQETQRGIYASVCGRAFAMDRNNNWERTVKAYDALFGRAENKFSTPQEAVAYYYSQNIDDENIPATLIYSGESPVSVNNNDAIIITNFREDRARQITRALSLPAFNKFERKNHPSSLSICTMTSYEKALPVEVAFPPPPIYNTLSDVISKNQVSQIHIAETEKYAHVTYFFNGGRESKGPYEEFFLVPSLKPEQFESNPQMSAEGVTQAVLQSIELGYKFIVFNFANCDMVGHTGNYEATVNAIQTVDTQFKHIWDTVSQLNGYLLITADHGNSEQMVNPKTSAIYKEHTISPVPFIVAHNSFQQKESPIEKITTNSSIAGLLSDIAPTALQLLQLEIPNEMTGAPLISL